MSEPVVSLLAKARALRQGRDAWRDEVGPVLAALRAQGVTYERITTDAGISKATAQRKVSRTSDRTGSKAAP